MNLMDKLVFKCDEGCIEKVMLGREEGVTL